MKSLDRTGTRQNEISGWGRGKQVVKMHQKSQLPGSNLPPQGSWRSSKRLCDTLTFCGAGSFGHDNHLGSVGSIHLVACFVMGQRTFRLAKFCLFCWTDLVPPKIGNSKNWPRPENRNPVDAVQDDSRYATTKQARTLVKMSLNVPLGHSTNRTRCRGDKAGKGRLTKMCVLTNSITKGRSC